MTPQQTAQILRRLHAAYGTEITEDTGQLWAEVFSGDDNELARDATDLWIRERTSFPTPAELRSVMRDLMRRAEVSPAIGRGSQLAMTGSAGGFKIAYQAYCDTVERDGRVPKPYEQFIGMIPVEVER